MDSFIIYNIEIHTMAERVGIIENGYAAVKNGKLVSVGAGMPDEMPGAELIDAKAVYGEGAVLYPGFIDGHTHLGICEDSLTFEGEDTNEMTDPCTPQLRALDAINPVDRCSPRRASGITCVAVSPQANPIGGQSYIKDAGRRIDDTDSRRTPER